MKSFNLVLLVAGVFTCCEGRLPEPKIDSHLGNSYQEPPDYLHMCYKNDIDFSDCITKTLQSIKEQMVDGISEMYVPPIEPLMFAEVDPFDVAGLRFKLKNILARGSSNTTVTAKRASLDTGTYELAGSIPRMLLSADFELSSAIQLVPFILTGKVTATILDIEIFVDCQTEVVIRNGTDFLSIESLTVKLAVGSATPMLWIGEQRMDLLNQIVSTPFNSRIIINAIKSGLEPVISGIALRFAKRMFSSVPYNVLIPDCRPQTNMSRLLGL